MLARLKPARGNAVRSDLLSALAERAGTAMKRHLVTLPRLRCASALADEGVPSPRASRAQSTGWPLSVSLESRPCAVLKTDSDKEQQNSLTAGPFCGVMGTPNLKRLHKSLSDSPRAGQILVILHLLSTPAGMLARCLHILGRSQRLEPVRASGFFRAGERCVCPFLFPNLKRYSHV